MENFLDLRDAEYNPRSNLYPKCTAAELRSFVKARTGEDIPANDSDAEVIRLSNVLTALDDKATFRFMDMAPEMRNRVYAELLRHDRTTGSLAYPALLRTCKQVHEDAASMLYIDSTVYLALFITRNHQTPPPVHPSEGKWRFMVLGDLQIDLEGAVDVDFDRSLARQLRPFKRVHTVKVNLGMPDCHARQCPKDIDPLDLGKLFMKTLIRVCKPKTLKINFRDPVPYRPKADRFGDILQIFEAMRGLSTDVKVEITGFREGVVRVGKGWNKPKKLRFG